MARRKTSSRRSSSTQKQVKFWASVIIAVILFFMQQQGKPLTKTGPVTSDETFEDVSVASIYDGDTFKINLNCSLAVYCEKVPVRVRGVDTPEVKGKTEREKKLAQKAKEFTQDFLSVRPISLSNCGRDKYFRLLCDVQNGEGKDLARELIKRDYGYSYQGGTKSKKYQ
ncbi:thermonuclease family protein [Candidatus Avelusimicrobium luingense]|uniref:thermonuclease family protein n=1 Tax=Candidatus Avelusimicrobium luingense TaxID=3416211 RepID=UPI003D0C37A0